jgi:hypothetical protein
MKKIFIIPLIIFILFWSHDEGNRVAMLILAMAFLDRGAAWFDRNVPASDPRKYC